MRHHGQAHSRQTNRLLGYPDETRLLIVNADDFGMCHAINEGIIRSFGGGVLRSTSLMVPCPWALHAMRWLHQNPETAFGIHLTAIGDSDDYRWKPLTCSDKVPSLVDETGYFYGWARMSEFLAQVRLDELELEFRAQIETVLAAGLRPTHVDWHSLRIATRPDIFDVMLKLASDYGLAARVRGQAIIEKVQRQGLPANDYDFLDSYELDTAGKPARLAELLRELPAGLSEWAMHPGFATEELMAIDSDGARVRQADFDFLMSPEARDLIRQEGIVLLNYSPLQKLWPGRQAS